MSDTKIFSFLASQLSFTPKQISTVAKFLDEGATVPFLARYRKEATDGLDEEHIRAIRDGLETQRTLKLARKPS